MTITESRGRFRWDFREAVQGLPFTVSSSSHAAAGHHRKLLTRFLNICHFFYSLNKILSLLCVQFQIYMIGPSYFSYFCHQVGRKTCRCLDGRICQRHSCQNRICMVQLMSKFQSIHPNLFLDTLESLAFKLTVSKSASHSVSHTFFKSLVYTVPTLSTAQYLQFI